jgi:hypothetical protein
MNELSVTELTRLRDEMEETMWDQCIVLSFLPGETDDFNVPAENFEATEEDAIQCGFKLVRNREVMDEAEVKIIDAELRLPFDTVIDRRDRIRLIYRLGEFILRAEQPEFEIVGEPIHGHSAVVLQLVQVTEE